MADQIGVRCTILRGGTSKGIYFNAKDLPPAGPERDRLLKAVLGSEDLLQIDGLGGSRLITSKLAIVGPPSRSDADVDYTYGIVPPGQGRVVYTSNCGNISAGVGPFAMDAGLVLPVEPMTVVRIHNTNTGKLLLAHVPVRNGRPQVSGTLSIPGVPGTGAEIFMDYRGTVGAKTGRGLPTGQVVERIALVDGREFDVSIGDVGNPCVFIRATALGLTGSELPTEIDANEPLLRSLGELRAKAAALLGLCTNWRFAERDSPALPLVVLVESPSDYITSNHVGVCSDAMDLRARLIFYNRCHESLAGTGSICTAAMAMVPGSVVQRVTRHSSKGHLRIAHPLGVMTVTVEPQLGWRAGKELAYSRLGFRRTARKLMEGVAYVPTHQISDELLTLERR